MLAHVRQGTSNAQSTNIHSLLDQDLNLIYENYRKKNKEFIIDFIKKYDSTIKSIEAFSAKLDQVFVNIIDNACYALFEQFNKLGIQFKPKLEICTKISGNHITITIRDNGIGIPQENLNKIFDLFLQPNLLVQEPGLDFHSLTILSQKNIMAV